MFNRKEIFMLATLALAKFTHIMDFMVMMPLGPQLMEDFGISAQQFGILVSSYTLSAGFFAIVGAFFIDRFDRKKVLLLMYAGFLIGTMACALSDSYLQLSLARTLTGVFGGLLNTLILSIVGDSFPLQKRATATGVVMSAMSAAAAFGVPVGVYFAASYSWQMPFFIVVAAAVPIWFGIWKFIPNINSHLQNSDGAAPVVKNPLTVLSNIFGNFNQLRALSLGSCLVMGQFMLIPFIAPYMVKNIGFEPIELTYIYLLGGGFSLFTGALFGRLADKFGHKRIFLATAFFSALPLYLVTHLQTDSIVLALVCTSIFFIFIGGRAVPSMTMVMSSVPSSYRASFMSFNTAFQQLAAGLAALISGSVIVESPSSLSNFNLVGYLAIGLTCLAMIMGASLQPAKN